MLGPERIEIPLCAGLELGAVIAEGVGIADPGRATLPWVTPRLGAGVGYRPVPWFAFGASAEVGFPLLRERFSVDGVGEVFRITAAEFAAGAWLDFKIRSPR